jgi:hypothetical protein
VVLGAARLQAHGLIVLEKRLVMPTQHVQGHSALLSVAGATGLQAHGLVALG